MSAFMFCIILCGCSNKALNDEKVRDIDFTVVPQEDIPGGLKEIIDESKEKLFKKTYSDKENLYIVIGYGTQPTTGYSIKVKELYESKNAVYLKTWLVGPPKTEQVLDKVTYPYIVLKIENTDKKIVFR